MAIQTTRLTVDEFDRFVELPENADKLFEYIGGEAVEVVSNPRSSNVASRIMRRVAAWVEDHDLGYMTGADGGYMVDGERYIPDVAFISKARQAELPEEGYNPLPPDLAVEVLSPSNTPAEMRFKIYHYVRAGTLMWVVDPEHKQVEVYSPDKADVKRLEDTLDGGSVLPGFKLPVKEIFPD